MPTKLTKRLYDAFKEEWDEDDARAHVVRDSTDSIESYPDLSISGWMEDFKEVDVDHLPSCPFSFYEVRREYLRRQLISDMKEER
jgi:hypothetical protein